MTKDAGRRLIFALPFLPVAFGAIATLLFFRQGGFGGGHGDLDPLIGLLAAPASS